MSRTAPSKRTVPLKRAIEAYGTVSKMAAKLGVTPGAISQWKAVPVHHAHQISETTGIPLHELRDDVWKPAEAAG